MDDQALEKQNAILAAIVKISQQLFVADPFEEKLARSLAHLTEALAISHAYILRIEHTRNGRTLNHCYEWSHRSKKILVASPEFQQISFLELGLSRWESLLAAGTIVHGPVETFPAEEQEFFRRRGILSILSAPIKQSAHWWGVIALDDCVKSRYWSEEEVDALSSLGNILGAAFATQQLYASERRAREKAEVLREFARIISTSLSHEEVLRQSVLQLRRVMSFDTASVYLFPRGNHGVLIAGDGFRDELLTTKHALQLLPQSKIIQKMAQDLMPLLSPDVRQLHDWIWIPGAEHVRSFIMVPLVIQGKMAGVFMVDSAQVGYFGYEELQMAQALVSHIANAIENAWLYEEKERQLQLASILQRVGTLLTTDISLETLYQQLFDLLAEVIHYDSVSLQLLDPGQSSMTLVAERGFRETEPVHEIAHELSMHLLARLPAYPFWQVIPDTRQDEHWLILPGSEQIRSWIGAALLVRGRLVGILNVDSHTENAYDQKMGETVAAFANQAAVAIERAQLYERLQAQTVSLGLQVTERTAELQLEKDRTLAILESVGEGIIVTDTKARILYVNPAIEEQSGYQREELYQQNPRLFRSPLTPVATYEKMWQTILAGKRWTGELINKRKDGTFYDLAVTIAPVKSADGEITSFVSVQSDISRFKELDRLKSKFVSNVSHELRTPLTNIKLYLTLLARGQPERRGHYLAVMEHEVARLVDLVQDLLDLSRLEAEPLPGGEVMAAPSTVLQELMTSLRLKAEHKGISLVTAVPETLPQARISVNHLGQLLTNLLENALQYTPSGGVVQLEMGTAVSHNRPMVRLAINDNGPGISAEDLPYIFDRFYRGELAKNGDLPGSGLGLSICKEIVNRYNGEINVTSALGKGTSFTVYLPANQ